MSLKAGAGSAPLNISGWPQTTDNTSLRVRVLLLDDGATSLAIVSLTLMALVRKQADQVRQAVARATGVAFENVLCACTHVHSGPPVFGGDTAMTDQVAIAAAQAATRAAHLQTASFGHNCDNLTGVSRVRRILRKDGSVITLRRAWPQWWGWADDPQTVGPEEPLDDLLTVLRLDDAAGEPLAAVFHFTCHPIPDYFGYAADLIERTMRVPCLVLNGCQGSVDTPFEVPMRGRTQEAQLPVLGQILAYRALELIARTETTADVELRTCSREIFLPVSPAFLKAPADKAAVWPEALRSRGFSTLVQCLRVGGLALVGIPGEAHVGFGRHINGASPFALTRAVGLANDEVGYLFSAKARVRGGYEPDPQYWGVVADEGLEIVLKAAEDCLRAL